ncbi:hypothetical protein V1286_001436 [Bradyrhizobium algeriense]|uniref:Conjugal transfer protein TrbI n=1 Tax=Bradyrhizobium algeriense TaxID=634784 RepID=A0ABU8B5U1_9BRAD
MVREGPAQPAPPPKEPYPAEKARGGEIILNTPGRRAIFIAGLLGAVVLAIVLGKLIPSAPRGDVDESKIERRPRFFQ